MGKAIQLQFLWLHYFHNQIFLARCRSVLKFSSLVYKNLKEIKTQFYKTDPQFFCNSLLAFVQEYFYVIMLIMFHPKHAMAAKFWKPW